ncbi:MAG: hypothetical protein JNM88_14350 [Chitinophagaceae bacterium]|nr:hypothetical protein [Chitinophagaceae bacterium]
MRTATAIFLLSLFAFSQYARQFTYLHCKLTNTLRPVSQNCNCASVAGVDKPQDESPKNNNHQHITLDDLFIRPPGFRLTSLHIQTDKVVACLNSTVDDGFCRCCWHPPDC